VADDGMEQLEAAIYEAAIVPEKWAGVLDSVAERVGARGGVFFGVSTVVQSWVASERIRDDMMDFVTSGWAANNTRMARGLSRGLHLMPRFVTEPDYYGPGELEREAIYTEFFYRKGLGHSAGTVGLLPHDDMLCFSFERGEVEGGAFTPAELHLLDSLRPHLLRGSLITARLGMERVRTAVDTLTAIGLPAAAVTNGGRVVYTNDLFAAASHIWTTRGGDRLALHDPVADMMLSDTLATMKLALVKRSVPIRHAGADGAMAAVVQVVPLRRLALDIFGNTAAVLVLSEPRGEEKDGSLLLSIFDLTPAEIDVARAIASGLTVSEISQSRGRSLATIRNQLRGAMEKTGSRRQVDLVLLLRSFAPVA
jgi:DNA-binding CsgD family transcriptional regulator